MDRIESPQRDGGNGMASPGGGPAASPATRPAAPEPPRADLLRAYPPDDRPRERILAKGAAALSTVELLAVLLRSGTGGLSAVTLAGRLLCGAGSLTTLLTRSAPALLRQHGLGPAKTAALLAVLELAQRVQLEAIHRTELLGHPQAVKEYLGLRLQGRAQEVFLVLFLDSQNRLISADELFHGTLNQTAVYPREVARRALDRNAAAVILAHNHPSGVAEPSQADRLLTDALQRALGHLDIPVLDHIIVAGSRHYSFAEHGQLG
ncbi:MAG: DNA repair protein RadC [Lautropia sp.]